MVMEVSPIVVMEVRSNCGHGGESNCCHGGKVQLLFLNYISISIVLLRRRRGREGGAVGEGADEEEFERVDRRGSRHVVRYQHAQRRGAHQRVDDVRHILMNFDYSA